MWTRWNGGAVPVYSIHMTHTLPLVMLALAASCGRPIVRIPVEAPSYRDPSPALTAPLAPAATHFAHAAPTQSSTAAQQSNPSATEQDRQVHDALTNINKLLDAYFDFNAYRLRPDAIEAVSQAAAALKSYMDADPAIKLIVEGHCDERGSAEFNLALGDRRAESVRDLLSQLGIASARMTTISYGENRPECSESSEACWQRNRRAHIRHER